MTDTGSGLGRVHLRLLVGVEHFHQQAALGALRCQFAQQPHLQGVMVGVVVLLADQDPWGGNQALDQLLWGEGAAGGQFTDNPQLGMLATFRSDRCRRRCDGMRLAANQQGKQTRQQNAHGFSLN
ncbi:hypothetical protein D3C85_1080300 [compost metagenome]